MSITALVLAVITLLTVSVDGIMWKLQPNSQKCLKEELQSDVLITGDYEVQDAPGQKVDYVVCTV
jgi:emp24/gp25L/p24 family/GOLD.